MFRAEAFSCDSHTESLKVIGDARRQCGEGLLPTKEIKRRCRTAFFSVESVEMID